MENILLSGFADEISSDFNRQIQVLNRLGMGYMEIRGVDKRGDRHLLRGGGAGGQEAP